MATLIFICGALPESSGKTTIAKALISELVRKGFLALPFKPLSSHSFWWRYETYLACLERRSLFSYDVFELAKEFKVEQPIEVLNPIDNLTSPLALSVSNLEGLEEYPHIKLFDNLAVSRFTYVDDDVKHVYCYRDFEQTRQLLEKVVDKAERLVEVKSVQDFLKLQRRFYLKSIETCFKQVEKDADYVVVEGYSDLVYPWRKVEDSKLILVAAPGYLLAYETSKFFKAIKQVSKPPLARFADVSSMVKPIVVEKLPPLTELELKQPILSYRYGRALKAVLDVLGQL